MSRNEKQPCEEREQAVHVAVIALQRAAANARNHAEAHQYESLAQLVMAREVEMDAANCAYRKLVAQRN